MITSLGEEGAGRCDHFTRGGGKELATMIISLGEEGADRCDHFTRGRRHR